MQIVCFQVDVLFSQFCTKLNRFKTDSQNNSAWQTKMTSLALRKEGLSEGESIAALLDGKGRHNVQDS